MEAYKPVVFTLLCEDGEVPISLPALTFFKKFGADYFARHDDARETKRINLRGYRFSLPALASIVRQVEWLGEHLSAISEMDIMRILEDYVNQRSVEQLCAVNWIANLVDFEPLAQSTLERLTKRLNSEEIAQFYCVQHKILAS